MASEAETLKVSPPARQILDYYTRRRLRWPTPEEAVLFAMTELGEAADVLLQRKGGWTRNNPENKPEGTIEEVGEELGDTIMMLMVVGLRLGVDPLESLDAKLRRKLVEWEQSG